jgi:hypothetical protein
MSQIRERTSDNLVSVPEALRRLDMALADTPAGQEMEAEGRFALLEHVKFIPAGAVLSEAVAITWLLLVGCRDPRMLVERECRSCPREWLVPMPRPGDDKANSKYFSPVGGHIDLSLGWPGSGESRHLDDAEKNRAYGTLRGQVFVEALDVDSFIKGRLASAARVGFGRPRKTEAAQDAYQRTFPSGHGQLSYKEVAARLNESGGPGFSVQTVMRAIKGVSASARGSGTLQTR